MEFLVLVSVVLVLIIAVRIYFVLKNQWKPSGLNYLYNECQRQLRLPPHSAKAYIEDYIGMLREKYPGQFMKWFLEKYWSIWKGTEDKIEVS